MLLLLVILAFLSGLLIASGAFLYVGQDSERQGEKLFTVHDLYAARDEAGYSEWLIDEEIDTLWSYLP